MIAFGIKSNLRRLSKCTILSRVVGRSENPGVQVLFGGHNLPPLVKVICPGGAMAPPGQINLTTGLLSILRAHTSNYFRVDLTFRPMGIGHMV